MINGVREPIFYSFSLDKPPGHKTHHTAKIKHSKKINKSVLSHITFYLEVEDHIPVDFNGEILSFICQLFKIK